MRQVDERPPLATLLTGLDAQQLQSILLALAEREPDLINEIERQIAAAQRQPEAPQPAPTHPSELPPPDLAAIRRQLREALREVDRRDDYDEYWEEEDDALAEAREVLDEVSPYLEVGDGRAALGLLVALTEEYLARWPAPYGDYSLGGEFFGSLGELWTEAILSADLTPAERGDWDKRLAGWQKDAAEYGDRSALDPARAAARQGWDDPALVRVLQGEITEKEAGEESRRPDETLAVARLNVLERQGRHPEYLYLAKAEGQTERYLTKLVQLGRIQEAVDDGLKYLTTADQSLVLAQALRQRGAIEEALQIAEHGLEISPPDPPYAAESRRAPLARWLRDEARVLGQTERALKAGRILLEEVPGLADYRVMEALAGERWPALREELLAQLRRRTSFYARPQIEIFLHEGCIEDAIAALGRTSSYDLIAQVADAAVSTHPDWVIRASRAQAEAIMDAGKATAYHHAVEWLERTRKAYQVAGREAEWRAYLQELLTTHQRKYKLVPMLKRLRFTLLRRNGIYSQLHELQFALQAEDR